MSRYLPVGKALRGQRQHHLVDAGEAPLPLLDDLRFEAAGSVARHLHLYRSNVGQHGLGADAVTAVAVVLPCRIMLPITEVVGDLTCQGRYQDPLGQLLQQPALPGQLQPLRPGPLHQHCYQLLVGHGAGCPNWALSTGSTVSNSTAVSVT